MAFDECSDLKTQLSFASGSLDHIQRLIASDQQAAEKAVTQDDVDAAEQINDLIREFRDDLQERIQKAAEELDE